jgi:hypothetical protein
LSLRSKPLEILLDLTAFRTCYRPLAANRGSRHIAMDCGPLRSKSVSRDPISRAKLLEVPRVGGFSLGQNGHGVTVGLRPNPGKQVVDAMRLSDEEKQVIFFSSCSPWMACSSPLFISARLR